MHVFSDILGHRANLKPEPGPAQQGADQCENHEREDDDCDPVICQHQSADGLIGPTHPARAGDLTVGRPEDRANQLLQDQAEAPGREQGLQRPAVEKPDDAVFDRDAERARDQESHGNRDE